MSATVHTLLSEAGTVAEVCGTGDSAFALMWLKNLPPGGVCGLDPVFQCCLCIFFFSPPTEVGVNMQPDYMIKFDFDQESGSIATDEETIIIGFSTQEKKGLLMLIRNDDQVNPEYISIEMNNNGGLWSRHLAPNYSSATPEESVTLV